MLFRYLVIALSFSLLTFANTATAALPAYVESGPLPSLAPMMSPRIMPTVKSFTWSRVTRNRLSPLSRKTTRPYTVAKAKTYINP